MNTTLVQSITIFVVTWGLILGVSFLLARLLKKSGDITTDPDSWAYRLSLFLFTIGLAALLTWGIAMGKFIWNQVLH